MGVLAEYVRKEVDQLRAEGAKRKELLDEWLGSVAKLFDQLEAWVAAADGGLGILGSNRSTTTEFISEPRLGNYDVHVMWITLGGAFGNRTAMIVPKARFVSAVIAPPGRGPRRADGIVEIRDRSTAEYYLFRWKGEGGDEWFIRNVNAWNMNPLDNTVDALDRDRFEAAVLQVLQ
ncbi:hypothetical protein [Gemmata sp.]|uniref:hypothetical protein n=1 Tax=Gemmata sp. TaxID=1914242 RepID=UPI003F71E9E1